VKEKEKELLYGAKEGSGQGSIRNAGIDTAGQKNSSQGKKLEKGKKGPGLARKVGREKQLVKGKQMSSSYSVAVVQIGEGKETDR